MTSQCFGDPPSASSSSLSLSLSRFASSHTPFEAFRSSTAAAGGGASGGGDATGPTGAVSTTPSVEAVTSSAFYGPPTVVSSSSIGSAHSYALPILTMANGPTAALPSFPVLQHAERELHHHHHQQQQQQQHQQHHQRDALYGAPPRVSAAIPPTTSVVQVVSTPAANTFYGTTSAPLAPSEFNRTNYTERSYAYVTSAPSSSQSTVSSCMTASTAAIKTDPTAFGARPKRLADRLHTSNLRINTTTSSSICSNSNTGAASDSALIDATGNDSPPKKHKVSRERQLKINAASRRCRKRQKLELQFLRVHVVELQNMLQSECLQWRQQQHAEDASNDVKLTRLTRFLNESIKKLDEMSPGTRSAVISSAPSSPVHASATGSSATVAQASSTPLAPIGAVKQQDDDEEEDNEEEETLSSVGALLLPNWPCDPLCSLDFLTQDEMRLGCELNEQKKKSLVEIAQFIKRNVSLESRACSPEVISSLPIDLDGWQLRLSITEKHFTSHNTKFFPFQYQDLYDFCWEMNVSKYTSVQQDKEHYRIVTPLADDVAHVFAKTIGVWSSSVHGVPSISYKSVICRLQEEDKPAHKSQDQDADRRKKRALILQQSVLDHQDLDDPETIPWLFKRWVSFTPVEKDGVQGTLVEAYRTSSYATGRLIYKDNRRYDEFCEHLIRRYAECNALLENMMARDPRFRSEMEPQTSRPLGEEQISERIVKDILLF